MPSKIKDVRAKLYTWKGPIEKIHDNFCNSAADLLNKENISADGMSTFKFLSWLVVEVETTDGHIGLGNAALSPKPCKSVVDNYLKPAIIGEDIWDYEHIWQKMYRQTLAWGRKGVGMTAISAVDIAIWDALGKAAKKPVYNLLGGKTKAKLPCYASKLYNQPLDELAKEAKGYLDQGFKAMKLRFGWGPKDGAAGMNKNIELIRTVRSVVGDDIDLMADVYMGWTFEYAKRMMRLIDNENLRWLEEPVIADDIDGYADLRSTCRTPISGGEHEYTLYGFRQLLEKKAVDVVQFDTNRVGGITQANKICALAEAFQIPVIPHAGQVHNFHVSMSSINAPIVEYFPFWPVEIGNELFWYIFDGEPQAKNGFIELDDNKYGLGIELSKKYLDNFEISE
tara:strand:- start:646 stop:1833 length:1188 start_codon:yes stop_codon:yes gene_type:complete